MNSHRRSGFASAVEIKNKNQYASVLDDDTATGDVPMKAKENGDANPAVAGCDHDDDADTALPDSPAQRLQKIAACHSPLRSPSRRLSLLSRNASGSFTRTSSMLVGSMSPLSGMTHTLSTSHSPIIPLQPQRSVSRRLPRSTDCAITNHIANVAVPRGFIIGLDIVFHTTKSGNYSDDDDNISAVTIDKYCFNDVEQGHSDKNVDSTYVDVDDGSYNGLENLSEKITSKMVLGRRQSETAAFSSSLTSIGTHQHSAIKSGSGQSSSGGDSSSKNNNSNNSNNNRYASLSDSMIRQLRNKTMPQNIRAITTATAMPRRFSLDDRWGSCTSPNYLSASTPPPEAFAAAIAAAQYLERKGDDVDHDGTCGDDVDDDGTHGIDIDRSPRRYRRRRSSLSHVASPFRTRITYHNVAHRTLLSSSPTMHSSDILKNDHKHVENENI
jgi:hypothetical protein